MLGKSLRFGVCINGYTIEEIELLEENHVTAEDFVEDNLLNSSDD